MNPRFAAIDLGTNTFHLLIVEFSADGNIIEIYRERQFVHLAQNGIQTIGSEPYQRGINTLLSFKQNIKTYNATYIATKGTAALRTASNGRQFIAEVNELTGLDISIIDGDEEAHLIYKGVSQALSLGDETALIMDIGGGSVEFIIGNAHELLWAQSFPIGVAVLFKKYHQNDPISSAEIKIMQQELSTILTPLYEALAQYPTTKLIGASGTFDVLSKILTLENQYPHAAKVNMSNLAPLYKRVITSTNAQRLAMPDIPNSRAELIVVALILAQFIINTCNIQDLIVSEYAMKEGILADLRKATLS